VWASIYEPTGNPINESRLIPWIQAYDIVKPMLTLQENTTLEVFARLLLSANNSFAQKRNLHKCNWTSWRLCIHSMLSTVLGDESSLKSSQELVEAHIEQNLMEDGASFDFLARDALHYHVYDLDALLTMAIHVPPAFLSSRSLTRIERAVAFLEPYFTGAAVHIEFANSPVAFDRRRREAGMEAYQNRPWLPARARALLRKARVLFPSVEPWTASVVDEKFDAMYKLTLSAMEGRLAAATTAAAADGGRDACSASRAEECPMAGAPPG
jgi:hypothetical protein